MWMFVVSIEDIISLKFANATPITSQYFKLKYIQKMAEKY